MWKNLRISEYDSDLKPLDSDKFLNLGKPLDVYSGEWFKLYRGENVSEYQRLTEIDHSPSLKFFQSLRIDSFRFSAL